MFLCHLRVLCGYFKILPYHIILGPRLHLVYFPHSHGPRWLNTSSMFSTVGRRKAGRNGMPTPFKGLYCPEIVHITFQNIPLARILLHGHYLAPREAGKYSLDSERSYTQINSRALSPGESG